MKAIATKQPTNESVKQNKSGEKGRSRSVSPLSTGMPLLQRKCACGGGCPRCKEELGIQTKLKMSEPGDKYEQEADRIADEVMRMPEPSVQRQVEPEEEEDEMVQRRAISDRVSSFDSQPESSEIPPIIHEVTNSPGQPLDTKTRTFMESRFGHDFSQVRIHSGATAAQSAREVNANAYTVEHNIVFGTNRFAPRTHEGRQLIAHELTHTVQQKTSLPQKIIQRAGFGDVHLAEARDAEEARQKALFFDRLRSLSPSTDPGLRAEIEARFSPGTDDRWLAETILRNGPEPRWSLADITKRQRLAMANSWTPEPGNIRAVLGTGSHTVEAFYFRGTSDRRALIIGGVHGSEPGGVEVVNDLLSIMRRPNAPMPFFSVIIVPELFSANVHSSRPLEERRASGINVKAIVSGHTGTVRSPDPNRQFPTVGADPASNSKLGCVIDNQQRCIEPENLVLLDLVNRFQPERVANVHGSSNTSSDTAKLLKGGPSITTDPRPGHEAEDDALALSMATEAQRLGVRIPANFMGKPGLQTTRYPTEKAPKMSVGVTLGQWGSHATPTRPAMNIILIETFGNTTSTSASVDEAQRASRRIELMNLAQILRDFFLAPPP